jgi:hypothetical protein
MTHSAVDHSHEINALKLEIESLGAEIKKLKAEGTPKDQLTEHISKLTTLKARLQTVEAEQLKSSPQHAQAKFDRVSLEELLKKRFFYAPSFQIYGGNLRLQVLIVAQVFPACTTMVRRVARCSPTSWMHGVSISSWRKTCWSWTAPF